MKKLDKFAYDIVCNWPKVINFNSVYNDVDYSQILRFYLWDKVARAIRVKNNIDFEELQSYKKDHKSSFYYTPLISKGKYKRSFFSRKKIIFLPFQTSHTSKLVSNLKKTGKYKVVSKQKTKYLNDADVVREQAFTSDPALGNILFDAVINGLSKLGVDLIIEDRDLLKTQICGALKITELAEKEVLKIKPNVLYVHSDNHPPFINYVLVAKKYNIPTFMYQHGLDCEHYYLDDCYVDHVAVWSKYRQERYVRDSLFQPKSYSVVGNIFVPEIKFDKENNNDKVILFLSRPHKSIKCYSPSRSHTEGFKILEVLLNFLKRNTEFTLILKLHPMDFKEEYCELINNNELKNRVTISNEKLDSLFRKSSIIITEDSTAGAEAMYYGKPCIHAHLAKSKPVLPFVEYGSAFPGFSTEQLLLSLKKASSITVKEMKMMKGNQNKFVNDFVPQGDINNLIKCISESIK